MQGSGLLHDAIQLPGVECVCRLRSLRRPPYSRPGIVGKKIPTTRRYKDLLDNKEIDCLIAAVPDHWHKQVVVDAVNAGKDIYCEKPMSHSAADGAAMVAAAHKTGRVVEIGSQRVSSVICAKAKELLANGIIGTLTLVEGSLGRNDPPARGNIRRRPIFLPQISIGTLGKATFPRSPLIPIFSRAGAAGRNTAPASPAICSSISSVA